MENLIAIGIRKIEKRMRKQRGEHLRKVEDPGGEVQGERQREDCKRGHKGHFEEVEEPRAADEIAFFTGECADKKRAVKARKFLIEDLHPVGLQKVECRYHRLDGSYLEQPPDECLDAQEHISGQRCDRSGSYDEKGYPREYPVALAESAGDLPADDKLPEEKQQEDRREDEVYHPVGDEDYPEGYVRKGPTYADSLTAKKAVEARKKKKKVSLNPEYLTIDQIMEMAEVTRNTVHRWIRSGELPAVELAPGFIRVSVKDFDDFHAEWLKKPRRRK